MPEAWSDERARQYEHMENSVGERGGSQRHTDVVAERTINKLRRVGSKTRILRMHSTGAPDSPLETRTREQLYNRAKELGIEGRGEMTKFQLIEAIQACKN